jgi:hypothetical protein
MKIKKFSNFIELIKEGLIQTHNIIQYQSSLSDKLSKYKISHTINIVDKLEFKLKIEYPEESDLSWIVNEIIDIYGYYPSYYFITLINGLKNEYKWDEYKYLPNTKEISIKFEAKYTDLLHCNDIVCPEKLYHLTYQDNIDPSLKRNNILKIGLYPKTYNRLSNHSSRIYLFPDISKYVDLLSNLKRSDIINGVDKKYTLLEIETDEKFILHTDPNYRLGYYTYDNIHPGKINVLQQNL